MKITCILLLILFICRKDIVIESVLNGLNIWTYTLFPLLYPSFILNDLILSTNIPNIIVRYLGNLYNKLFLNNINGVYVFFVSLLCGTPTNVKVMKELKLTDSEINKCLISSFFFNPLLIISLGGFKLFIIIFIGNIMNGLFFRNIRVNISDNKLISYPFSLNKSITNNLNVLLSILGTVVIFSVLINLLPINNIFIKFLINSSLELTNSLDYIKRFFESNIYLLIISFGFGGLSIFTQIKSILSDTFINYKLYFISRLSFTCICVVICWITNVCSTLTFA